MKYQFKLLTVVCRRGKKNIWLVKTELWQWGLHLRRRTRRGYLSFIHLVFISTSSSHQSLSLKVEKNELSPVALLGKVYLQIYSYSGNTENDLHVLETWRVQSKWSNAFANWFEGRNDVSLLRLEDWDSLGLGVAGAEGENWSVLDPSESSPLDKWVYLLTNWGPTAEPGSQVIVFLPPTPLLQITIYNIAYHRAEARTYRELPQ